MESTSNSFGKIAVIGMAGRYPESRDLDQFWENLKAGRECITFFTEEELIAAGFDRQLISRPDYVRAGGVYEGAYEFDAPFFSYTPREAELIDPQQRVFLECAWEAIERAGYDLSRYSRRVGLFAGCGMNLYLHHLLAMPEIWSLADGFSLSINNEKDFLTTRVAYKLNLRGPCVTVQTACSTSLVGVALACQSLLTYQCDMALAGGVSLDLAERPGYLYQEGGVSSPDGHCRAFDAAARGTSNGSGVGIVVLKRLEDALADRDVIHAVILGFGMNNDGAARAGFTAPGRNGQVEVYADAIAMAGIDPETIGYIECHGTGTPIGDPIEIAALTAAYRAYTEKRGFCAVGSVKTNIGHTDTAAGVAGLTKAVLALKHKLIPPSLHFERPNPEIDFDNSPFYVNTELREWKAGDLPRRAAVTSLGIGGANAHIILEEPPPPPITSDSRSWQLLTLSAKTASALETMTRQLLNHLRSHPDEPLSDVAYTLHVGRQAFPHRRVLICRDRRAAIASLETAAGENVFTAVTENEPDPVVFLFPGQAAQYPGMAADLYRDEPVFRRQIDLCAEVLTPELPLDLRELIYPRADESAAVSDHWLQTQYAQPALFAVEFALARLWAEWGVRPEVMIGHSLGEYVAACLAGVFSVEDGLKLVAARGRLMQRLPPGSMISALASEKEVRGYLKPFSEISVAAVNGPSVSVLSGPCEAIVDIQRHLEAQGVPCKRLVTSHAFHSAMMDRILDDFGNEVRRIALKSPRIPYLSNVSGTWISAAEATDPGYWVKHLRHTVRFSDGVDELLRGRRRIFLEVGPGRTLAGLIRRRAAQNGAPAISSLPRSEDGPENSLKGMLAAAGRLWAEGVEIDWEAFHRGETRRRLSLPTYPFERRQYRLTRPVGPPAPYSAPPEPALKIEGMIETADSFNAVSAAHLRPALRTAYEPPRTALEQAICNVWRNALGMAEVGVFDNFIELGGHSLLAIQLTAGLQQLFGIDFTVTDLYQRPTVAGLAEAVVAALARNTDQELLQEILGDSERLSAHDKDELRIRVAAFSPEQARLLSGKIKGAKGRLPLEPADTASPSYLITIRSGGSRRPLFLADPSSGSAKAYAALVKSLDAEQPLYAFQRLVLGSLDAPPFLSITDLAANYIDALQALQPEGPYLIGGYSMGGVVAFEMALQLKARGGQVDLVVMIDSAAPFGIPDDDSAPYLLIEDLIMLGTVLATDEGKEFNLSPAELAPLSPDQRLDRFARQVWEQRLTPVPMAQPVWRAAMTTLRNSRQALRRYTPRVYDGRVVLIKGESPAAGGQQIDFNSTLGWGAFCARPIEVHSVPADHIRIMAEPHIRTVGEILQRSINHGQ